MKNKAVVAVIVLVVVFLAGFVPQHIKVNHLDAELRQVRQTCTSAELRDLAGLTYVQANQKNYGIAAGIVARFFNRRDGRPPGSLCKNPEGHGGSRRAIDSRGRESQREDSLHRNRQSLDAQDLLFSYDDDITLGVDAVRWHGKGR